MSADRFVIYGVVPSEHADDNSDLNPDNQSVSGKVIIYTSNDENDAKTVMREGGFIRQGQYYAAQELLDTRTNKVVTDYSASRSN